MQQFKIALKGREYTVARHADGTFELPPELAQTKGLGSGLKPAWEPVLVFRKPLEGTLATNVLKHGTGGLNIDATRVRHASKEDFDAHKKGVDAIREKGGSRDKSWKNTSDLSGANEVTSSGRWPSNVLLEHVPDAEGQQGCRRVGTKRVKTSILNAPTGRAKGGFEGTVYGAGWKGQEPGSKLDHADADGCQEVDSWECVDGCPVLALDQQSGDRPSTLTGRADPDSSHTHPGTEMNPTSTFLGERTHLSKVYADAGGASRFFTQLEPDKSAEEQSKGRWPSNAVFIHAPGCERVGLKDVKVSAGSTRRYTALGKMNDDGWQPKEQDRVAYENGDGKETVEAWTCVDGCPVKELHEQGVKTGSHAAGNKGETNHVSGKGYGGAFKPMTNNPDYHADEGGVDRFFTQFEAEGGVPFRYIPKANRKEAGCGEFEVQHVTVKPLALMRWLVRLVTKKGGVVLDPYAGSGSTCHAAILEGMNFIGMERDPESHAEAVRRLEIVTRREQERKDAEELHEFAMGGGE